MIKKNCVLCNLTTSLTYILYILKPFMIILREGYSLNKTICDHIL